ncbi:VanZ family protein [Candidatus Pelagibacter sp.]|nr:VanZ family protein [Candidatus Pelagibacter sp.]
MINFFSKYKLIFYLLNLILIIFYLFPGSLLGCFLYNDCYRQPQITDDFIISSNHLYTFFLLSIVGFFTYRNSHQLKLLNIYLALIAIVLEILHVFIPNRSFEFADLFGNLIGVLILIIIQLLIHKNENFKN